MSMTENGVSTCQRGQEKYEKFKYGRVGRTRRVMYHYDFRAETGELFSTVKPTLAECRRARDLWLEKIRKNSD